MSRIFRTVSNVRAIAALGMMTWVLSQPSPVAAQTEAVEYYATDAIGSVRVVFDASGNVLGRMDYAPFGAELYTGLFLPSQRFADLTRDGEAGQDYAQARMYQLRSARFTRPDPIFAGLFEPQLWNRYAYAVNNPLWFTDPSGLCPEQPCLQMPWHEVVQGFFSPIRGVPGGGAGGNESDGVIALFEDEAGAPNAGGSQETPADETGPKPETPEPCGPGNPSADGLTQFIPIYGPVQSAMRNFDQGKVGWGIFDSLMAATDVALIKGALTGLARGFI